MSGINSEFQDRITSSLGLRSRAGANSQFGSADFDAWVCALTESVPSGDVLDICCGTGNQLVLYARRQGLNRLVGVDLSGESLAVAHRRLADLEPPVEAELLKVAMEDSFVQPTLAESSFDLISCFYGLYYARDVNHLLNEMIDHLNVGGHILIVGPYGPNNASLFSLLQRHFELPELVLRSATTFMEQEVLPTLEARLKPHTETFVNRIVFPSVDSVMDYWRASTFYSESHAPAVLRDVQQHFEQADTFVVEKHVMAVIACRE